ncbi:FtsX-like permease family protein [Microbacterium sp. RU33B]|uniref:FtsX-like permease family protein n=1 Tax=Microbacterium sp. RU33B TaxID=1907390 RepID=UPI000962D8B2|nr:FtsX-like permease family protein [Microbacterium sp. RU33B]SIT67590.1 hypothetical protein SAMN05880545_0199 [Microbacterium sp. RU33B]
MTSLLAAPGAAPTASRLRRVITLTALLSRPGRQGRAAIALPLVAFAVTTALLLTVVGGTRMFLTQAAGEFEYLYAILSVLALLLLAVPVLTLGAAAARLSSRRRNDRLSTLRLLGATSGEVGALTVLEASVIAFAGALAGVALYLTLLPLVGLLPFFGGPIGPGAVWTGWAIAAIVVGVVTLLATVSAVAGLRRVQLTPLGVRRRTDAPPRRIAALVVGLAAFVVIGLVVANIGAIGELLGPALAVGVLLGFFAGALALVNLVGTPIVAVRGRSIARRAKSASGLIAGRELAAHAGPAWRRVSGIAMIAFIAVVGGVGMAIADMAGAGADAVIFADIRTGVLVTLGAGFLLLASSIGVTQAAAVLEDRDLIVGLDRLGIPPEELRRARRMTVMVPLRWAAIGGAALGATLSLPIVGVTLLVSPMSLVVIAATFAVGFGLVLLALAATTPLVTAIRRAAA